MQDAAAQMKEAQSALKSFSDSGTKGGRITQGQLAGYMANQRSVNGKKNKKNATKKVRQTK